VFDINDFDETLPGPWEWDVKRLAASMLVASMDNGFQVNDHDRIELDTGPVLPLGDARVRRLLGRDTLEFDRRVLLEKFELYDVAVKVVGVGSVGTRCWIALMMARGGRDPLFLQIKEADASVLEPLLGVSRP
jgi:uncharacterized protein (DUF2252 family)